MNVYADDDTVYIDYGLGPVLVIRQGQPVTDTFALRGDWDELHTEDGAMGAVLDRVRTALDAVVMSAKARRDVAAALDDFEPDGRG